MLSLKNPEKFIEKHHRVLQRMSLPPQLKNIVSIDELSELLNRQEGAARSKNIYIEYTLALLDEEPCETVLEFLDHIGLTTHHLMFILKIQNNTEWFELIKLKLSETDITEIFDAAVEYDQLKILQWLENKISEPLWGLIQKDDFYSLRMSIDHSSLDVFLWLVKSAPSHAHFLTMLQSENFEVFDLVAYRGQRHVFKWLVKKAPELFSEMIQHDAYRVFYLAASYGHLKLLKWISASATEYFSDMIQANDFIAFREAAQFGHLNVLKWLAKKAPALFSKMISANSFYAFRKAAAYNHVEILEWIAEQVSVQQLWAMISAEDFYAFRKAAKDGSIKTLEWMAKKERGLILMMIRTDNFYAFRKAAECDRVEVLQWIAERAPEDISLMITAENFYAFRKAVEYGHVRVCQWITENASIEQLAMMVKQNEEAIFVHPKLMRWCLLHPDAMMSEFYVRLLDFTDLLLNALKENDTAMIELLLTTTKSPSIIQWRNEQALLDACCLGSVVIVELCLEAGYTEFLQKALLKAVQHQNYHLFALLIGYGADVEEAINILAKEGCHEAIKKLKCYSSNHEDKNESFSHAGARQVLFRSQSTEAAAAEEQTKGDVSEAKSSIDNRPSR